MFAESFFGQPSRIPVACMDECSEDGPAREAGEDKRQRMASPCIEPLLEAGCRECCGMPGRDQTEAGTGHHVTRNIGGDRTPGSTHSF